MMAELCELTIRAYEERYTAMWAAHGMMYTVNVTSKAPTAELIGPKKGKMIARNQMGSTTGILHKARKRRFFVLWTPRNFSHTK